MNFKANIFLHRISNHLSDGLKYRKYVAQLSYMCCTNKNGKIPCSIKKWHGTQRACYVVKGRNSTHSTASVKLGS